MDQVKIRATRGALVININGIAINIGNLENSIRGILKDGYDIPKEHDGKRIWERLDPDPPEEKEEKMFPIQDGPDIPWVVGRKAYDEYEKQYGNSQSMERMAERGGFAESEMDMFYPGWREHNQEIINVDEGIEYFIYLETKIIDEGRGPAKIIVQKEEK